MDDISRRAVIRWWETMFLPADQLKEKGLVPAPSAHKAQLRRCESADAAMLSEGFRVLWMSLDDAVKDNAMEQKLVSWATIAAVLVHVKRNRSISLAAAAGSKGDGDKPIVSELRFSKLQNAKTPEDFLRRIRRIVQQLKGELDVKTLADNIHQWFDEFYQFRPRKADKRIAVKWAMDYYRAASSKAK